MPRVRFVLEQEGSEMNHMPTVAELNSSAVILRQRLITDVRHILQSQDHTNLVQSVVDRGTSPINFDTHRQHRGTSPLTVNHVVGLLETIQHNVPEERPYTTLTLRESRKRPRQQQENGEGSSSSNVAPRPQHEIDDERNNLLNNDVFIKIEIPDEYLMAKGRIEHFKMELSSNFGAVKRLSELLFEYKKDYDQMPIPALNVKVDDHIDNLEREWERELREANQAKHDLDVTNFNRLREVELEYHVVDLMHRYGKPRSEIPLPTDYSHMDVHFADLERRLRASAEREIRRNDEMAMAQRAERTRRNVQTLVEFEVALAPSMSARKVRRLRRQMLRDATAPRPSTSTMNRE
ncbi:hypothetical protein GCK72_000111 [Caenorhabditis remanei]|uniref:Uncharacterized protein n=1 Tax=Caenorhabditis remanei TaxID=31234 RepID=A0A6A5HL94_CAERE|nr:hypothetical protein GCK72_000111 [Caenorhabditis remanei]KAF1768299.1 hypothetical protein GCK72_000111 [Caenorhabditis remanei]